MRHSVHSIFYDQAEAHEAADRYDQALELLYQLHRWVPEDPQYWLRLGLLSLRMTDPTWLRAQGREGSHWGDMALVNADVYLERAIALAPGDPQPLLWRAWLQQHRQGNMPVAESLLNRARAMSPDWPYSLMALARLEMARAEAGYGSRAVAHLQAAFAILPESPRLHYDRGAAFVACDALPEAREAFQRALKTPALQGGPGLAGTWLAEEFHGDPVQVQGLINQYYASLVNDVQTA
jgi:tetratricopeptide (TPR) repeat protein